MINGKVARILSDKEVILNIGSNDSVKENMRFVIFSEGDHIIDPETGEDLGMVETIKGRLIVSLVMERMSRAKTGTYQEASPNYSAILQAGILTGQVTRRYTLQVNKEDVLPINEDLTVRVGDRVRLID